MENTKKMRNGIVGFIVFVVLVVTVVYFNTSYRLMNSTSIADVSSVVKKSAVGTVSHEEKIRQACLLRPGNEKEKADACACMAEKIANDQNISESWKVKLGQEFDLGLKISQELVNAPSDDPRVVHQVTLYKIIDACSSKAVDIKSGTLPMSRDTVQQTQVPVPATVISGEKRTVLFYIKNNSELRSPIDIVTTIDGKEVFKSDVIFGVQKEFNLDLSIGKHMVLVTSVSQNQTLKAEFEVTTIAKPIATIAYFYTPATAGKPEKSNFSFGISQE